MAEQNGIFIAPHLAPEMHGHLVSAFPRAGFIAESHGDPDRNPLWYGGLFTKKAEIKMAIFTSTKVQALAMISIGIL